MSRLENYMNEDDISDKEEAAQAKKSKATRVKSKGVLKKGLRKLDDQIEMFVDEVEKEIEKIDDNPSFQYKMGLMLANLQKEEGEFLIALRQIVHSIAMGIIPQIRGHASGVVPDKKPDDNREDVRDEQEPDQKIEVKKK